VVLAAVDDDVSADLERGLELGGAGWRARMLATVPSNLKSPQWLAEQAQELAAEHGLGCEIWDEKKLARHGFGGVLAVGRASATPPRLIRLDYKPSGSRKAPRVVLVGKGITFDTGGLSIKPGEGMTTMKRDMTGGAVVMAVMAALGRLGCPLRVTGLIPAAENAISGAALRPGDVVTHYGGRTTEVLNTDAEGRLVLADAMAYAVDTLDPDVLVDVATLTGAIKVALGQRVGSFFANDETLASRLYDAGETSGEPLWRMPLESDYEDTLSSTVADAKNNPGGPQAVTAALFLQHFAGDVPWAHLDLASVGDSPSDSFEWTTGPSGFGARALLTWLSGPTPLAGIG
jgi:leucyl aminopeptidase